MRLKKLGGALLATAALSAVLASSAFAAAETADVKWYTGGAPGVELVGSAALTSSAVGEWEFRVAGLVSLKWTNTECEGCTIENSGGTAVGSGNLKFTGVTVSSPANCSAPSTITTKTLAFRPDYMIGATNYWRFEPSAGPETGYFTLELTGASCSLKTALIPKGTLFMQSTNKTEFQAVEQEESSSAAINGAAGGTFHVGAEPASLTGAAKFKRGGVEFGTH